MIHIFDVDQTVIKKTSAQYFLSEALKEKLIRLSQIWRLPFDLLKYKLAVPDSDFIEKAVKYLPDINKSDLDKTAENSFKKQVKRNIYHDAFRLIKDAMQKGEQVLFATSSFDFIIRPLEDFFNIKGSLATRMEYHDGKTTGCLAGNSLFGIKKKEAVEQWLKKNGIDSAEVCFYSDSYTDIPLLEYCGTAVAVNPDRRLAKTAKKHGWKILHFKKLIG